MDSYSPDPRGLQPGPGAGREKAFPSTTHLGLGKVCTANQRAPQGPRNDPIYSSKGGSRIGVGWATLTASRSCSLCSHLPPEGSETNTSLLAHLCRPRYGCACLLLARPVSSTLSSICQCGTFARQRGTGLPIPLVGTGEGNIIDFDHCSEKLSNAEPGSGWSLYPSTWHTVWP